MILPSSRTRELIPAQQRMLCARSKDMPRLVPVDDLVGLEKRISGKKGDEPEKAVQRLIHV